MGHKNCFDGLTGREFEEAVGEVLVIAKCHGYMDFATAVAQVKAAQPWDPTDPQPRVANDLHAAVCEALGVDDYSEVALYTAVGSALDVYHGIDALIVWQGRVVTLDLTTNPAKSAYKADMVLWPVDLEEKLESTANFIAKSLQRLGRKEEVMC